jgi:uncharacterized cupredoxin-like copper-binding protein
MSRLVASFVVAASLVLPSVPVLADAGHGSEAVGAPAPKGQGRIVRVEMTDNAYNLKKLAVKSGETVRFIIVNKGTLLHEFNLNTAAEHDEHRPMMAMMVDHGMITADKIVNTSMTMPDGTKMSHTEPNSVLLEPGKSAEISWKFATAGTLEIACNIPGHSESGMVAPVTVTR